MYFHSNAVLDDFGQLKVGSKVRVEIAEKEGQKVIKRLRCAG